MLDKEQLLKYLKERDDDYTEYIRSTPVISYQDQARLMQRETCIIMATIKEGVFDAE